MNKVTKKYSRAEMYIFDLKVEMNVVSEILRVRITVGNLQLQASG